jgi:hypothetical protein
MKMTRFLFFQDLSTIFGIILAFTEQVQIFYTRAKR